MLLNNVFSIFCHLCQLCWEAAEASHHPQMRTQAASDATSVGWKRLLVCDGVTHVSHVSWSSAVWCILWWISHLFVLFDREGAILHLCNTDCDELEERVFKVWMILSYTQLNINIPITFPSLSPRVGADVSSGRAGETGQWPMLATEQSHMFELGELESWDTGQGMG